MRMVCGKNEAVCLLVVPKWIAVGRRRRKTRKTTRRKQKKTRRKRRKYAVEDQTALGRSGNQTYWGWNKQKRIFHAAPVAGPAAVAAAVVIAVAVVVVLVVPSFYRTCAVHYSTKVIFAALEMRT